jgi:SAM-dependent methyltransferase
MFTGDLEHYVRAGRSAVENVRLALVAAERREETIESLLDFGCGHGRITRAFKEAFPNARLAACDIDRDGVEFCAATFGATPYYSSPVLAEIEIGERFDLVFCGSVFTHLSLEKWPKLLSVLYSALAQDAVLVFSTHGRYVAHRLRSGEYQYGLTDEQVRRVIGDYDAGGFGYCDYSHSAGRDGYGVSLSLPSRVCETVEAFPDFHIVLFRERGWNAHQDVVAAVRRAVGD